MITNIYISFDIYTQLRNFTCAILLSFSIKKKYVPTISHLTSCLIVRQTLIFHLLKCSVLQIRPMRHKQTLAAYNDSQDTVDIDTLILGHSNSLYLRPCLRRIEILYMFHPLDRCGEFLINSIKTYVMSGYLIKMLIMIV